MLTRDEVGDERDWQAEQADQQIGDGQVNDKVIGDGVH